MNREPVKQCTMKRERDIITIDEYGRLNLPTDTAVMWMTEVEIVELFGTTAGAVHVGIKVHYFMLLELYTANPLIVNMYF